MNNSVKLAVLVLFFSVFFFDPLNLVLFCLVLFSLKLFFSEIADKLKVPLRANPTLLHVYKHHIKKKKSKKREKERKTKGQSAQGRFLRGCKRRPGRGSSTETT